MIAAAVQTTKSWWTASGLGFNFFDLALAGILCFGFWRGRKNGMTKEILPAIKWVVLVAACTLGYAWLGGMFIQWGIVKSLFGNFFKEQTAAFVTAYLAIALVVYAIFCLIKNAFREKVDGSNAFGSGEYYLGMLSGTVRYACMTVFFLALLNAPVYTLADVHNRQEFNNRWFGGGLEGYSGDFIPSIDEVQAGVFKNSLLGPAIKNNLSVLLINTDEFDIKHATAKKQPVIHMGN
ncbi:MAG: CvpA family protein [Verrucomicrobiota bacterium]|jgi:hypothetical protein